MIKRIWSVIFFSVIYVGLMPDISQSVCYRPNFTNPYAIILAPDQAIYPQYYAILLGCLPGHTNQGFSIGEYTYCDNPDSGWNPDPSGSQCLAQCNATLTFDNDINVIRSDGSQTTIFDHGTVADFSCAPLGYYTGPSSATCDNGTFSYTGDEPSCLEAWKIAVSVTVPLVVIIVASVVVWCCWRRGSRTDSSSDVKPYALA